MKYLSLFGMVVALFSVLVSVYVHDLKLAAAWVSCTFAWLSAFLAQLQLEDARS